MVACSISRGSPPGRIALVTTLLCWLLPGARSSAPVISSYSPAQGATITDAAENITLTFDKDVISAGSGNVVLTPTGGNSGGSAVTISVADTAQVSFAGQIVTINPTNELIAHGNKNYTVTIDSTAIRTPDWFYFAGISGNDYRFLLEDTQPPQITSYSPTQAQENVSAASNIILHFNEHVTAGTGNILLSPVSRSHTAQSPGSPVSIDVTSAQVNVSHNPSGSEVTIDTAGELVTLGAQYTVSIGPGVVTDILGTSFGGFSPEYRFDVADTVSPTVELFIPANHSSPTLVGATLRFSEKVKVRC